MLIGRWQAALFTQAALITLIVTLCWSRWAFEPTGIVICLTLAGLVYLASTGLCLSIPTSPSNRPIRQFLHTSIFTFACLLGLTAGFLYKDRWLGIHINYVPSMSMYPTLKPGQFIVLDTWIYQDRAPQPDDVVVFQRGNKGLRLVKRVALWPDGKLQHEGLWYVLGDNQGASHDSRYFGGIHTEQLAGQVKLVLLTIDHQHQLLSGDTLQVVR
ncbi:S26 family signal peptidase [Microbulbifer sp. JMSA003]|uniref:S26 family signal peptidase n=1 Tax=Microbulbifer sp. JMSA003 TaxID=3243369 RepID=UPI0040398228